MEKPLNLVIIDAEEQVVKVLNEMKMPIKVMQMVIDEVKRIVDSQAGVTFINERKQYDEYLKSQEEIKNA
jgi:ribose 5-phosphate isomerase